MEFPVKDLKQQTSFLDNSKEPGFLGPFLVFDVSSLTFGAWKMFSKPWLNKEGDE